MFAREWWEIDGRIGAASASHADHVSICRAEEGVEPKDEALNLPVHLRLKFYLHRESRLSLQVRVRSWVTHERLWVRTTDALQEQWTWLRFLIRMSHASLVRCSRMVPPGGGPVDHPQHTGDICLLAKLDASLDHGKSWARWLGKSCCPSDPILEVEVEEN